MGKSDEFSNCKRRSLFETLGVSEERVIGVKQVHSQQVFAVSSESPYKGAEGDGMITSDRTLVLGVTVADCLPIFLYSRDGSCFGILHSGWKGTGIVAEAIEMLKARYGVRPEQLHIVMGPGIGPCCYQVDEERADLFTSKWGEETVEHRPQPYLDLRKANLAVLRQYGPSRVTVVSTCTCCHPDLGSYRREGKNNFTRMIALIGYF
jgi:hypothetical protein